MQDGSMSPAGLLSSRSRRNVPDLIPCPVSCTRTDLVADSHVPVPDSLRLFVDTFACNIRESLNWFLTVGNFPDANPQSYHWHRTVQFNNNNNNNNVSVVVKALCYKPESRGFDIRWSDFLIYLILSTALGPGVYSASNRNEYQKHKNNNVSGE
jgi:hypothetical protein